MVGPVDHRVTRPTGVVAVPTTDLRALTRHPADEHLVGSPGVPERTRLGDHFVDRALRRMGLLQVHVHRSDRMASLTAIDHTFDYSYSCPSGRQAGREDPRLSTTS